MTLIDIEAALLVRIGQAVPGYLVQSYPERPSGFNLIHPKGAVLVRFAGGSYGVPLATDVVVQERRTEWELTVVVRHLREHGGLYTVLDLLRTALTGFQIAGCEKALPVKEEFLSETDGVWQYAMLLAVPTVNVELGETEALPLITRLTVADNFGNTEEIP